MDRNNLMNYLDFNEDFEIHTTASTFELVYFTIQKSKPITFYSRKHTDDK